MLDVLGQYHVTYDLAKLPSYESADSHAARYRLLKRGDYIFIFFVV